ncbi:MAG: hypothetical protein LBB76_04525 [Azoarcus sp.]|jgi:hypothetical protein|nr:hypothetical protein [Azoarcus sp.]
MNRQAVGGGALLAALVVLLIASGIALAAGEILHATKMRAQQHGITALARARAALIGYAAHYPEMHAGQGVGYLPCPDQGNDGSAWGSCHIRDHGALGRFPYRTLGLPVLQDGGGQCLWYALAGSVKNNPKPMALNWDSPGQFKIVDTAGHALTAGHDAVAVLIAPGEPLPGQRRPSSTNSQRCAGSANVDFDLPLFLDRHYPNDIAGEIVIISGLPGSDANDIVSWITIDDLFAAIRRRPDFPANIDEVLATAAAGLESQFDSAERLATFLAAHASQIHANRAHGLLPDAKALGFAPGSQYDNWHNQSRFVACIDGRACLEVNLADSPASPRTTERCRALVLFGGERQRGATAQYRRTAAERADPAQYLEGGNLDSFTTGSGIYDGYRHLNITPNRPASEDLIRCIP